MGAQRQPARAMGARATALSNPIHGDARKRTKVERPDAAEDDVRLAQRSRNAPARAPALRGAGGGVPPATGARVPAVPGPRRAAAGAETRAESETGTGVEAPPGAWLGPQYTLVGS